MKKLLGILVLSLSLSGNAYAASTQSEIYDGCYENGISTLGKKRAKQYCKCTSTMLSERFPEDMLKGIRERGNDEEIRDKFSPAVRHCNINPLAFKNTKLKITGSDLLKLECKPNGLLATRRIVIDADKRIATVNNTLAFYEKDSERYMFKYMNDDFDYSIYIVIFRNNGEFTEFRSPWDFVSEEAKEIFMHQGICKVSEQLF